MYSLAAMQEFRFDASNGMLWTISAFPGSAANSGAFVVGFRLASPRAGSGENDIERAAKVENRVRD